MAQNISSRYKTFFNLARGLKDTSQKAYLERDYTKLHPCYINRKGGAKGLDWCCIGENWRKLAEVG